MSHKCKCVSICLFILWLRQWQTAASFYNMKCLNTDESLRGTVSPVSAEKFKSWVWWSFFVLCLNNVILSVRVLNRDGSYSAGVWVHCHCLTRHSLETSKNTSASFCLLTVLLWKVHLPDLGEIKIKLHKSNLHLPGNNNGENDSDRRIFGVN